MNIYPYGHDFGNSETCGVLIVGDEHRSRCIPSVSYPANSQGFSELGNKLGDGRYIYSDDEMELYMGDLAIDQSFSPDSSMGDINRYASHQSRYFLLTVAASLTDEREFGIHVVTGLPVLTFLGNPELRKAIPKALSGTYEFALNGKKRTIHVTVGQILMEGASVLPHLGLKGDLLKAVIDIGGRTTDLYVVRGQSPIEELCRHGTMGVELALRSFNQRFERKHGRELSSYELKKLQESYVSSRRPDIPFMVDGIQVYGAMDILEQTMMEEGRKIVSFVSKRWNETETGKVASSYDDVLIIGGGAYYFGEMIQSRIRHARIVEQPEMANVEGYAMAAERLLYRRRVAS